MRSQCDRVLAVLQDGKPHTMEEIHERAGTMRLNSRVSDLRDRGHNITCDRTGRRYVYTLHPLHERTAAMGAGAFARGEGGVSTPLADGFPDASPSISPGSLTEEAASDRGEKTAAGRAGSELGSAAASSVSDLEPGWLGRLLDEGEAETAAVSSSSSSGEQLSFGEAA